VTPTATAFRVVMLAAFHSIKQAQRRSGASKTLEAPSSAEHKQELGSEEAALFMGVAPKVASSHSIVAYLISDIFVTPKGELQPALCDASATRESP
jgi:hypothetical protein